jgi:hypothetical protein
MHESQPLDPKRPPNVATFAQIKGQIDAPAVSLQKVAAIVRDRHIAKSQVKSQVQVSDWSLIPLAADQIAYTAMDARVSLELFRLLAPLLTVSGRVDIATPGGTAVNILGGQTIIASGILLERRPRAERARAEVRVSEVRVSRLRDRQGGSQESFVGIRSDSVHRRRPPGVTHNPVRPRLLDAQRR